MLCFILSLLSFHFFSFPVRECYSGVNGDKDVLIFVCVVIFNILAIELKRTRH